MLSVVPAMRCVGIALWAAALAVAAEISGLVVDATTGEPISRVAVRGCSSVEGMTNNNGGFHLDRVATPCVLQVAAVGYRPVSIPLDDVVQRLEIALHPDTLRRSDSVAVAAPPFAGEEGTAVALAGNELRNLGSVLADDPLRAVQALPGVTSSDDFSSQFAIRGAGFNRTGIYLDGILLHSPFHTLQGDNTGASLAVVEGEVLESAVLHPSALPPRYADRTAGALDLRTRNGDSRELRLRSTLSMSNAGATVEGPLGKRGSWLAAARKSYLQYIIERTAANTTLAFGFRDTQGKLSYALTESHHLSLSVVDGHSGLDRTQGQNTFGLNTVVDGAYQFTLASVAWRWTPAERWSATNRVGWIRENFLNRNRDTTALARGTYGEWLWNADSSLTMGSRATLDFGVSVRRVRDEGFYDRLFAPPTPPVGIERYRGNGVRNGGYVEQSWSPTTRLHFVAGGRLDTHTVNGVRTASAYASAATGLWSQARLFLTWGTNAQFPELSQFFSISGTTGLLPERANHAQIALEQTMGSRTRIRAEAYTRQDRDLLFRPGYDPRIEAGRVVVPSLYPSWSNSLRGWARGFQVFVQRRAANNLTGWAAYAFGRTYLRDGITGLGFPSDFDSRHSVRVYGSYRWTATVNVSTRWIWATGLPVRGYYRQTAPDQFALSPERNQLRLPSYQRADFRVNKAFIRRWGQLTLFAEVINLTNRENLRCDDLRSYDTRTGVARLSFDTMFPVLPSAGLVIDF